MPGDEYDWLFDYVLQFLESDKFDCSVMDFVDEKCEVFDSDEENKLIYTTIHNEFKEHLETLISSNLSQIGIDNELFYNICEISRNGRDINSVVFERLVAIEDFETFKRLMIKRNMELQVEALKLYQTQKLREKFSSTNTGNSSSVENALQQNLNSSKLDSLPTPEAMKTNLVHLEDLATHNLDEKELQEMLESSLMEMELLHRREELEAADLEAALVMSLTLEEERVQRMAENEKELQAIVIASAQGSDHDSSMKQYGDKKDGSSFSETSYSSVREDMKADVKSLAIPSDDSTTAVSSFVLNSPTSSIALAVNALGHDGSKLVDVGFQSPRTPTRCSGTISSYPSFNQLTPRPSSGQSSIISNFMATTNIDRNSSSSTADITDSLDFADNINGVDNRSDWKAVDNQTSGSKESGSVESYNQTSTNSSDSNAVKPRKLSNTVDQAASEPKKPINTILGPIKGRGGFLGSIGANKPLPAINISATVSALEAELDDRKKLAEQTINLNQEIALEKRKQEESLRQEISAATDGGRFDKESIEKRAQHMREQRDKIIAMKKAERERKLATAENFSDLKPVSIDDSSTDDKKASLSDAEVIAEEKRMKLRRALANRLKTDLLIESLDNITSISPKNIGGRTTDAGVSTKGLALLDQHLDAMKQLRDDSLQRDRVLMQQINTQQNLIAKNVKMSGQQLNKQKS